MKYITILYTLLLLHSQTVFSVPVCDFHIDDAFLCAIGKIDSNVTQLPISTLISQINSIIQREATMNHTSELVPSILPSPSYTPSPTPSITNSPQAEIITPQEDMSNNLVEFNVIIIVPSALFMLLLLYNIIVWYRKKQLENRRKVYKMRQIVQNPMYEQLNV